MESQNGENDIKTMKRYTLTWCKLKSGEGYVDSSDQYQRANKFITRTGSENWYPKFLLRT